MTPNEYRAAIAALGLSQVEAAKLFHAGPRTSRRWASGETPVPRSVEIALLLMLRFEVTPEAATRISLQQSDFPLRGP